MLFPEIKSLSKTIKIIDTHFNPQLFYNQVGLSPILQRLLASLVKIHQISLQALIKP